MMYNMERICAGAEFCVPSARNPCSIYKLKLIVCFLLCLIRHAGRVADASHS